MIRDSSTIGLKGTMSEYELSLLRQRGIAARDCKARRGEYRFMLPPGFCWNEAGKIEIDPDEHVVEMVRLVFAKFRELGSARQVFLWLRSADLEMRVVRRNSDVYKLIWKAPAYDSVMQILHNPLYAGAYAFGRRTQRTRIVDGRARKVSGFDKPREEWNVLLRDNHPGYSSWQEYEDNQRLLLENAHMKKNCAQVGPWRAGTPDRADALRTLWADDAGVLLVPAYDGPAATCPRVVGPSECDRTRMMQRLPEFFRRNRLGWLSSTVSP